MDKLDQIPWKALKHAYGSAGDVPDMLRALRTALDDMSNGDAPIWELYHSICHQGTVYEATSFAVPYLLELAEDPKTPCRTAVLAVLADIALGLSGQKRWIKTAHAAVAKGRDMFARITKEGGDVALGAAHVLAQFPEYAGKVGRILRRMLAAEKRAPQRAGLLLLFGDVRDSSPAAIAVLTKGAKSANLSERQAAAVSFARLKLRPMPPAARKAIAETLASEESDDFGKLPWDAGNSTDNYEPELRACLTKDDRQDLGEFLIVAAEAGSASPTQATNLVDLLFPQRKKAGRQPLTAADLSPMQKRAVSALVQWMEGGRRLRRLQDGSRGLPDTMRQWRALAAGREPTPIDENLPVLGHSDNPQKPLSPDRIKVGQRIHHREFGYGVVAQVDRSERRTDLRIDFEEEGRKWLRF